MLEKEIEYQDQSSIPVRIKNAKIILEQMKKCVCKIKKGNEKVTGFFAKIPYKSSLKIVLITNKHILNEDDIKENNIITVSINNEEENKDIKIDNERLILIDEEKDLVIIEIKEKDNIKDYFEIDERCCQKYIEERFINESLYILSYPNGKEIVVSFGLLKKIEDEYLYHLISTEEGSSGSPILLLDSLKLIGIHKGYYERNQCNKGLFIKYAIDKFNKLDNNIINYNSDTKKLHKMIAHYYGNFSKENFEQHLYKIKELIQDSKELKDQKNSILKAIDLFKENLENDKLIREVITGKYFFFYLFLNKWLNNPKINSYYDSIAYFTARIMYSLDLYGYNNNGYLREERTIYRVLKLDYNGVLLYEKSKGKIILFPNFFSCSESKEIAYFFTGSEYNDKSLFSVIFTIKFNHKENWISNGINIQSISNYEDEKEILIQAFSFFYIKDVKIDINRHNAEIYLETIGKKEILEKEMKKGKDIEYNEKEKIMQIKK